jgi:hypothetical protein
MHLIVWLRLGRSATIVAILGGCVDTAKMPA